MWKELITIAAVFVLFCLADWLWGGVSTLGRDDDEPAEPYQW